MARGICRGTAACDNAYSMNAEQVAAIPECAECGAPWLPADPRRWRAYLDIEDEVRVFCPECAEREFVDHC
jgi:Zn finger protein HypA/HybF involved in hydrogenase expression